LFRSPTLVWHNGKYDAGFLKNHGVPARVDEDTMLMHYLLSEGVSELHGLKELSGDLLGADPKYDAPVKKFAPKMTDSYAKVPREILYKYAAQDVIHTFQIHDLLAAKMEDPRYKDLTWPYRNILLPAARMLQLVEQRGVWVHKPTLEALARDLQLEFDTARGSLIAEALTVWNPETYARWKRTSKPPKDFNPGSPAQLLFVFGQFGIFPVDPRTGKPTTADPALKDLPQTPFVEALRAYRRASKMLSTYVEGIYERIETDGRVHATYLLHGTSTGRLSSRGPNMQNIPRDARIRNVFQAPPGYKLVELDFSQVELRVLAYLSGDAALQRVYAEGRDLHDEVATSLFGPDFTREQRIRAKFVNFGIAYGRGADSLVAEFKMPKHEAQAMIRGWWETFPDARHYIMTQRAASRGGKPLVTPFGRRRRFDLVTNQNRNALENEAANFVIQSTASDLTLLAAIRMQEGLREWNASIINLVHDSILIEVPEHLAQTAGSYARQVMETTPHAVLQTDLPFTVSMGVAQAWGSLK
jgi:DNA polymerase-1